MRVIELMVDGQRVKLTTDQNIMRAVERGDLTPTSRVVITEHDDEVFIGEAIRDETLAAIFPAHMQPRAPKPTKVKSSTQQPADNDHPAKAMSPTVKVERSKKSAPSVPLTVSEKSGDEVQVYANESVADTGMAEKSHVLPPRPWRHWVGKFVDLNFLALGAFVVAAIIQSILDPSGAGYAWLCVPLFFILDGLMMHIFGGSLGKLLVNIQVRKNGRNIGLISAVKRSLHSHVVGAGLWLPIVSIVMMLGHYGTLKDKGRSEWDINAGNAVVYGPVGFVRWLVIILFFTAYVLAFIGFGAG